MTRRRARTSTRPGARLSASVGAQYAIGDERYVVYRVTASRIVLRSVDRLFSFIDSDVSGWPDPEGWVWPIR